jgi:hypothetical protein
MSDFALHHRQAASAAPQDFSPKTGDLISAKFSEDNQWYVHLNRSADWQVPSQSQEIVRIEERSPLIFH